ncbi:MAG: amidohydrolase family protein [Chloroflexi bacterium]|nr:amidohydrolase family protein [Chloroflexota bacterium]
MRRDDELVQLGRAAHGPEPTATQREAVAGWETLLAKDFAPRPLIRVPKHDVPRARFAVIDVHKHLGYWPERRVGGWPSEVDALADGMDELNIRAAVNLDGFYGDFLARVLDRYAGHTGRFITLAGAAWHRSTDAGFGERAARDLEASVQAGARGFKVFKALGLWLRDSHGELWMPDDPRLDPLWSAAGELGVPVLIHVADPEGFFRPPDPHSDRLRSLARRPEWFFGTPEHPTFEALMERQVRLFQKHLKTTFIGAHVLNRPDNLAWVGSVLESCPNVYAEISARITDLGRQPRTARAFFERYQDRVLFGTDGSDLRIYPQYFRVLETEDDLILPPDGTLPAGTWPLYGLGLPDTVLRKLYHDNVARIVGLPPLEAA